MGLNPLIIREELLPKAELEVAETDCLNPLIIREELLQTLANVMAWAES